MTDPKGKSAGAKGKTPAKKGEPAAAKAAAPKADAAKPAETPAAEAPKAEVPKAVEAPAASEPKAAEVKSDAPKAKAKKGAERKQSEKEATATPKTEPQAAPTEAAAPAAAPTGGERKKSEKAPKEAARKKSEKAPEKEASKAETSHQGDVESVTEGVQQLDVNKAEAGAKKGGGKKSKGGEAENKPETQAKPKKAEAAGGETKAEPVVVHTTPSTRKLKILGVSGSLRKESYNTALLRAIQKAAPSNVEFVVADISRIPLYNQDLEYQPNEDVKGFKELIKSSDGIIFCTPEYNYSIPGVLKNAIDVASRPWGENSWANKPAGLLSASVGWAGGLRAQLALRQSFVFLQIPIYPGQEIEIGEASKVFDAAGNLTDKKVQDRVTQYLEGYLKWVQQQQAVGATV